MDLMRVALRLEGRSVKALPRFLPSLVREEIAAGKRSLADSMIGREFQRICGVIRTSSPVTRGCSP
jgi:hypothetical protein